MGHNEQMMVKLQRQHQRLKEWMMEMAEIKAAMGSVIRVLTGEKSSKDPAYLSDFPRNSGAAKNNPEMIFKKGACNDQN